MTRRPLALLAALSVLAASVSAATDSNANSTVSSISGEASSVGSEVRKDAQSAVSEASSSGAADSSSSNAGDSVRTVSSGNANGIGGAASDASGSSGRPDTVSGSGAVGSFAADSVASGSSGVVRSVSSGGVSNYGADSVASGSSSSGVVSSVSFGSAIDAAGSGSGERSSAVRGRSISGMSGWNDARDTQYHIQTDEGPERYFRYQTQSGQYRKEKRLQDGSVVGSYGWVGADGILRLRDYVADDSGYRVVRTKSVFVGRDEPIDSALQKSKSVPSQGGTGYVPPATATPAPLPVSAPPRRPSLGYSPPVAAGQPSFNFGPPASVVYPNYQPLSSNALQPQYSGLPSNYNYQYQTSTPGATDRYDDAASGYYQNTVQPQHQQFPLYDGISATHNGFRYYLPRQYQEEQTQPGDRRDGSFGYIDPFGIRRVIYYNTSPGSGFVHRKNNRYVGFDATPYDPRF